MRRNFIAATALTAAVLALTAACSSSGSTDNKTSAPAQKAQKAPMSSMTGMSSSPSAAASGSMKGTTTGSAQAQEITVHTTDMLRFQPSVIHARVGTVKVKLMDDGSYPHNMDVTSLHMKSADVSGDLGANSTTFTLKLTKAGTYPFECTYHDTAGMKGMIVVS